MTTRYIAIEHNSGFIWGDTVAASPEAACEKIDRDADVMKPWATWESVPPIRDTDGGFHVYTAPEGFPVITDGQDQGLIERVEAECKHVGDYRPRAGMTFEEFQATRHFVPDLAKALPDYFNDAPDALPAPGYVYCDNLIIEEVQDHWPDNARALGRWYLMLGNWERISDDLSDLERHLYEYAQGEGIA
jgi:hypothetical protein